MRQIAEVIGTLIFFSLPVVWWYGEVKLSSDVYKIYKKFNVSDDHKGPYYRQLDSILRSTSNKNLKKELEVKEKLSSNLRKILWLLVSTMLLIFAFKDYLPR